MKARSSKGGLVAILALVVYCFFENMGEPKFLLMQAYKYIIMW